MFLFLIQYARILKPFALKFLLSKIRLVWHEAEIVVHPMRIELTNDDLLA